MLPLNLPSSQFRPLRYRPDGIGSWSGHIPFVRDLVASLQPAVMVELGTYYGESYFAFCQSVAESRIDCTCYAVDNWRGDPHTGPYSEGVFQDVEEHNRQHYGVFSHLLRMDFEEAAGHFAPNSIDLLHLDGYHTYETIRRDVATWLPKVRPGGIALLHDIAVRQGDFGVWKLWEELSAEYRVFGFEHSCGLGVLLKPGSQPEHGIVALLFGPPAAADAVRGYYELCAERLENAYQVELHRSGRRSFPLQLFWKDAGEEYSEQRSLKLHRVIGPEESVLRLEIPPLDPAPAELRLDFGTAPLWVRVSALAILDSSGAVVWAPDPGALAGEVRSSGMELLEDRSALLIHVAGRDPSMLLPPDAPALARLRGGGTFEIRLAAVDPGACLARRAADRYQEWNLRAEALQTAQRLAAEREQKVRHYEEALAAAQGLLAERDAQLRAAQSHAARREDELLELKETLERTVRALAELEAKHTRALARLDGIEQSMAWRATRPLLRLEQRLRGRPRQR